MGPPFYVWGKSMSMQWTKGIAFLMFLMVLSCINHSAVDPKSRFGELEVIASQIKTQGQNVLAKNASTTWDSLVIRITAPDIDTMLYSFKFTSLDPFVSVSCDNVPAGEKRTVEVFTKSKTNGIIHVSTVQVVDISSAEKKILDFILVPTKGSIYIDISNIPTNVKKICADFDTFSVCETRSAKLYMNIDNVPDKTADTICIVGTDSVGTVVYKSSTWLFFAVLRDTTISSKFIRISTSMSLTLSAQLPGITLIQGQMTTAKPIAFENGKLIISEIMYNANDSEYVELYNPGMSLFNDSLFIEIDGTNRSLGTVTIPSHGFFVIGRRSLPWVDTYPSVSSALDLSSGGNWLCLRSKAISDTVLDWVAFLGGSNSQDWPNLGTQKKSIVLDTLIEDAQYNNIGRNWTMAQTGISSLFPGCSTSQIGTPKSNGL